MSNPPPFWSDEKSNPGVDRKLLDQVAELHRQVEKFGSSNQPSYRIAPALGGTVIRQTSRTVTTGMRSPFSAVLARAN